MKTSAFTVLIFIHLLFFAMCGYLYLVWSHYFVSTERPIIHSFQPKLSYSNMQHVTKNYKIQERVPRSKSKRSAVRGFWSDTKQNAKSEMKLTVDVTEKSVPSPVVTVKIGTPRFPNTHIPLLKFDSDEFKCSNATNCRIKTEQFKRLILKEFHRILISDSNVFTSGLASQNIYNVQYNFTEMAQQTSGKELLCALKNIPISSVKFESEFFKTRGFRSPYETLEEYRTFNVCAIISSSGAMLGSHLGKFIDSHDMVMRFNNAPTDDFSIDVGSKTTFRIVNSQVVSNKDFRFLDDQLYKNISIIIWDPANQSSSLEDWFRNPDFPFFPVYKKFLDKYKNANAYVLNPSVLWDLWVLLQNSSYYRLRRNPPSSGFIGLWFSLNKCKRVRMFEYIPSVRATRRCHYYGAQNDTGCTLGAWHPLAQEKILVERMRENSDLEVFQRGIVDLPGFLDPVFQDCT